MPGGHLEYQEDPIDCCRREVEEETGLKLGKVAFWRYTNDIFPVEKKHYITLLFTGEYIGGEPEIKEPTKCEKLGWFQWNNLPKPLMTLDKII